MTLQDGFSAKGLWFGRHPADGDILVLDGEQAAPGTAHVTLFSLTQLRPRTFSADVVESQIVEISDPEQLALAEREYRRWPALKAERERERERERSEAVARQRDHVLELHRLFIETLAIEYPGVRDSADRTSGRRQRSACARCGIRLDDIVQTRCAGCDCILCSCGACGCRSNEAAS